MSEHAATSLAGESHDGTRDAGPVIVGANWYRFRPSEEITHNRVMSECFIWVVQGGGTIRSGGRTFRMDATRILRLPWHHRVEYQADGRRPYQLGTIHIVPRHTRSRPVIPRVAHRPGDPLLDDPDRTGAENDPPAALSSAASGAGRRVADLGTFAIDRFVSAPFSEPVFRALAEVIRCESHDWDTETPGAGSIPGPLEQMVSFVRDNLVRPLAVEEVARAGGCSSSTAERLFNAHTGTSVSSWIRQTRLREAALLLRTSGLRVGEVSSLVGFSDPLYFSRVFRRAFGVPPSRYGAHELRP